MQRLVPRRQFSSSPFPSGDECRDFQIQLNLAGRTEQHIGAAVRVASITPPDGSVEADRCAMFYPVALRTFIEIAEPSWARKRIALTMRLTDAAPVPGEKRERNDRRPDRAVQSHQRREVAVQVYDAILGALC